MQPFRAQTQADVTLQSSLTDVLTLQVAGQLNEALLTLKNTGNTNATNGLSILCQHDPAGPWLTWLSGTDFASASARHEPSNNPAPNAIGAGQTAYVRIKPGAVEAIKIQASSASGTTISASLAGRP